MGGCRVLAVGVLLTLSSAVLSAQSLRFSETAIDGTTHSLQRYADKVIIVNYWATWCPPCLAELPLLSLYHDAHKDDDAVVFGINFEDIPKKALHTFVDDQMLDFPIFQQNPKADVAFGKVMVLPTTFFISADRKTIKSHVGEVTKADVEAYVKALK